MSRKRELCNLITCFPSFLPSFDILHPFSFISFNSSGRDSLPFSQVKSIQKSWELIKIHSPCSCLWLIQVETAGETTRNGSWEQEQVEEVDTSLILSFLPSFSCLGRNKTGKERRRQEQQREVMAKKSSSRLDLTSTSTNNSSSSSNLKGAGSTTKDLLQQQSSSSKNSSSKNLSKTKCKSKSTLSLGPSKVESVPSSVSTTVSTTSGHNLLSPAWIANFFCLNKKKKSKISSSENIPTNSDTNCCNHSQHLCDSNCIQSLSNPRSNGRLRDSISPELPEDVIKELKQTLTTNYQNHQKVGLATGWDKIIYLKFSFSIFFHPIGFIIFLFLSISFFLRFLFYDFFPLHRVGSFFKHLKSKGLLLFLFFLDCSFIPQRRFYFI